jgi:mannose-6-phosphate isomerase-like protein (cupin superfamily)
MAHEDLLYVIEGTLRLELEGEEPRDLGAGECFVIPPGKAFRGEGARATGIPIPGYRWVEATGRKSGS